MVRHRFFLSSALVCIVLLGGCFPGTYTSRQAAGGFVVDAVSGEPLSGVRVSDGSEEILTDNQGAFFFARQTSVAMFYIGGEHPAWPHWGYRPLSFSRDGYVALGGMLPDVVSRAGGTVALEPAAVPEGIAALDAGIYEARVTHRADGSVLVWLVIDRAGDFGSLEEEALSTRDIAEKVVRSGLAGASPDLGFVIRRRGEGPHGGESYG